MALETEHYCPKCNEMRTFYRTASTLIHLGEKTKWSCSECDHRFVRIGSEIESDPMA